MKLFKHSSQGASIQAVGVKQRASGPAKTFVNNRLNSIAQRRIQDIADNSVQLKKASQLSAKADSCIQTKGLNQFQLSNQVVQKVNGVPGLTTLSGGDVITHGSPVRQFTDRTQLGQVFQNGPDAPAWFATESRFSVHVSSMMHGGDAVYVHSYPIPQNVTLNLLEFDDV